MLVFQLYERFVLTDDVEKKKSQSLTWHLILNFLSTYSWTVETGFYVQLLLLSFWSVQILLYCDATSNDNCSLVTVLMGLKCFH